MDKKIKILFVVLVALIALQCGAVGLTYGKYTKHESASGSAHVANFAIEVGDFSHNEQSFEIKLEDISPAINQPKTYAFVISNGSDGNYSEVALSYTLSLSTTAYLPLNITLGDISLTPAIHSGASLTEHTLSAGVSSTTNHSLVVDWASGASYQTYLYAGIVDVVTITVNWEQID